MRHLISSNLSMSVYLLEDGELKGVTQAHQLEAYHLAGWLIDCDCSTSGCILCYSSPYPFCLQQTKSTTQCL